MLQKELSKFPNHFANENPNCLPEISRNVQTHSVDPLMDSETEM